MSMKIKNLLPSVPANIADTQISNLVQDSRRCGKGDLYVAITCDGVLDHIRTAVAAGAVAVVIEEDVLRRYGNELPKCQYIPVACARSTMSSLAAQLYPQQPAYIAAVTGTNGKSSVANFIRQICDGLKVKAVSFGTLGLEYGSQVVANASINYPKLTTPDALSLHKMLNDLADMGVTHFSFEASSHGLDQYRLHHVKVMSAGFTNFTQDHLDYHGTMEAYFEAKTKLFTEILTPGGTAVINTDVAYGKSLQLLLKPHDIKILTYGLEAGADLQACNLRLETSAIVFDLVSGLDHYKDIRVSVAGAFQIENILCAIGQVMAFGITLAEIVPHLSRLKSARGRMELVGHTAEMSPIYIDYAHTPDALMRSLGDLRAHVVQGGRLVVVFGCGGNRDASKRAIMGEIANDLADTVYVTDDNPRFEDPQFIRTQIISKCPKAIDSPGRQEAIEAAIQGLRKNDILLIAGKGHETGQIIRDEVIPFVDEAVVRQALQG